MFFHVNAVSTKHSSKCKRTQTFVRQPVVLSVRDIGQMRLPVCRASETRGHVRKSPASRVGGGGGGVGGIFANLLV